ncbi:hypothetical protein [Fibrobacter sp. UWH4]|uniref:hypothetical protein n=1 Tax=Fibrobacter sp. UWH4 TaxID=1896210 RepID=UPI000914A02F|nr:hypothetical protein [Fibrobacter sp. UWH4]SHL06693.1 hypothetical protein SAMN05720762_10499 [Fibrobacter sp. UWH4]
MMKTTENGNIDIQKVKAFLDWMQEERDTLQRQFLTMQGLNAYLRELIDKDRRKLIEENLYLRRLACHAMWKYACSVELFYRNMSLDGKRETLECGVKRNGKTKMLNVRCKSHMERGIRMKTRFKESWIELKNRR